MSANSNRIEEIRQLVAAFDRAAADVALMKSLPRVTGTQTLEWRSWNTNDPVIDRSTLERIVNAGIATLTKRASDEIDELSVKLNAAIPADVETDSE